jgi:hypothetical protein
LRLAERQDRTPIDVARRIGLLEGRHLGGRLPAGLALWLSESETSSFAAACRLDDEEVRALTLADRLGTPPEDQADGPSGRGSVQVAATTSWIAGGRTRYCPDCLRGDDRTPGYWQASWQLPWHFACLRHLRLLADDCPACGTTIGKATRRSRGFSQLIPNAGSEGLRFDQCRCSPEKRGVACGRPLSVEDIDGDAEHRAVLVDRDALHAQVRIAEIIGLDYAPEDEPLLAGEPLSLPLWTAALQGVAILVRASVGLPGAPKADMALWHLERAVSDPNTTAAERSRLTHTVTPPDSAWAASSLLARAVEVLDTDSRADLHAALAPYVEPVREHLPATWKTWLRQYPDQNVKRLLKRHGRWTPIAASGRRSPGSSPLDVSAIPQRVPPPHDRLLAPYRNLGVTETGLHRSTCILLRMRAGQDQSLGAAASALGLRQADTLHGNVRRLNAVLEAAGLSTAYDETLRALEAALAAAPVDWAARRAALAGWTVSDDDWTLLKAALMPLQKPHGRQPDWEFRRRVVGQIVWEDLTAGEPRRSPEMSALAGDFKNRDLLALLSRQFRANIAQGRLPGMGEVLDAYREQVLATVVS